MNPRVRNDKESEKCTKEAIRGGPKKSQRDKGQRLEFLCGKEMKSLYISKALTQH